MPAGIGQTAAFFDRCDQSTATAARRFLDRQPLPDSIGSFCRLAADSARDSF
jgi:hypothetical protein